MHRFTRLADRRRTGTRRAGIHLAALLVIAGLVASCGSPRRATGPWLPPDGFDQALWSVVDPSSATGGTLRVVSTRDCGDWSTAAASGRTCRNMHRLITRQLMTYGVGSGRQAAIAVPDLAEGRGLVDATRTKWTYRVRAGVRWSDGTELTPEQVAGGVRRLGRRIPGVEVRSVAVGDDRTIVITLAEPMGDFDAVLALPQTAPVRAAKKPAYLGPFALDEIGEVDTFVRNPQWDSATDDVRRPLVDRVEFRTVGSAQQASASVADRSADLFIDGSLDDAVATAVVTTSEVGAITDNPGTGGVVMLAQPGYGHRAWRSADCRRGVYSAVDRLAVVDALAEGLPFPTLAAQPATTLSAPTTASYDWSYEPFPIGDRSGDVDAAAQQLASCSADDPLTATLAIPDNAGSARVAAAIRSSVNRAGIEVEIQPIPLANWPDITTSPSKLQARGIDWVLMYREAAIPGVWGYWYPLASGDLVGTRRSTNVAQVRIPAIDVLFDSREIASQDPIMVDTVGRTIDRLVLESGRYVPLAYDKTLLQRPAPLVNVMTSGGLGNQYDVVNIGVGR